MIRLKIIRSIMCFFIIIFSCAYLAFSSTEIKYIKIYNIDWLTKTVIDYTPHNLITSQQKTGYEIIIKDSIKISNIERSLKKKCPFESDTEISIDARTVCLLVYKNRTDTLSFSNFSYYQLNDSFYQIDFYLLELIMSMVPQFDRYGYLYKKCVYFSKYNDN